jgi:phosphohistidine phosphatase
MRLVVVLPATPPGGGGEASSVGPAVRAARRWRRAARGLARLGIRAARIYHGPAVAAVAMAGVLARALGGEARVTASLDLPPGPSLLDELAGRRIALVGQRPWLDELVALLVADDEGVALRVAFERGAVAWLAGEPRPGGMSLRALVPLKILGRIGRR